MPQSNNESNDFIVDMESVSAKAMQLTGVHPTSFINYTVMEFHVRAGMF